MLLGSQRWGTFGETEFSYKHHNNWVDFPSLWVAMALPWNFKASETKSFGYFYWHPAGMPQGAAAHPHRRLPSTPLVCRILKSLAPPRAMPQTDREECFDLAHQACHLCLNSFLPDREQCKTEALVCLTCFTFKFSFLFHRVLHLHYVLKNTYIYKGEMKSRW